MKTFSFFENKISKMIIIIIAIILCFCAVFYLLFSNKKSYYDDNKINIVTSFYPMYTIASNVAKDIPEIEVTNLTASNTGCLHDYQITTSDMIKLSHADVLVVNGDGMENFIEKAISTYDDLKIVNASEGIKDRHEELLGIYKHDEDDDHSHEEENGEDEEHEHYHENDEHDGHEHHHDHGENSHYWVSITLYIEQVKNVKNQLSDIFPQYEEIFKINAINYINKLNDLNNRLHQVVYNSDSNKNIVTFHEAFDFFAEELGLNIVAVIEREPGTYPSARDVADIIDEVNSKNVSAIFVEPQYSRSAADTISRETGVKVFTLDPIVTGELEIDAYINIMNQNINTLEEALN